ncbi:hypothetical protein P3342_007449 [Pyrenophora teres f. teres]|nr:hypothetical protein P3342_007449 [Pyrenophora teres f. teres]
MAGRNASPTALSPPKLHQKRAQVALSGSASQPISISDTQQPSPSLSTPPTPSPPPPPQASYVSTFESQLRDSRPEAEIVAPFEGSEEATIVSLNTADEALTHIDKALDGDFEDNYEGIDWDRLPRFIKPPTTSRRTPS